jgi:cupin fold WbuC family metalloprotein
VEPGANIPIHRHPEKEESFVVLRGRIRVITYNDDGTIIENIVLNPSEGRYGVNVGKNVWHTVEALFMLVTCSATINYIRGKIEEGEYSN